MRRLFKFIRCAALSAIIVIIALVFIGYIAPKDRSSTSKLLEKRCADRPGAIAASFSYVEKMSANRIFALKTKNQPTALIVDGPNNDCLAVVFGDYCIFGKTGNILTREYRVSLKGVGLNWQPSDIKYDVMQNMRAGCS